MSFTDIAVKAWAGFWYSFWALSGNGEGMEMEKEDTQAGNASQSESLWRESW